MALDVDAVIDRRRLSRRLTFWRAVAVLAVLGAMIAYAATQISITGKHVARLAVQGAILSDRPLIELIERLKKNSDVAGVVVAIDSPGGTSVGGERLYNALRDLDGTKPVVAHINTVGASAAYMTALASDHIVAHRTSLTGSIGVLIQYGEASELLKNIGVAVSKVDSGPLKAEPNPFEPASPAAIAALQSVVDDTYDWFLSLVVDRRKLAEADARRLADGRIFTGHQALEDGLIDEIGGEKVAIAWLQSARNVPRDLPVKTYRPTRRDDRSLFTRMGERVIDRLLAQIGIQIPSEFPMGSVDGLWSIWQAPALSVTRVSADD
ncbi:MAG: signal peptide peptidase SppA [Pseudomonadota bacterium]